MKKGLLAVAFAFGAAALSAAPAKTDPVAEGFPVWQGVTPKNYVSGREITPSDLRHKVTVVVEVSPDETLHAQLMKAGEIFAMNPLAVSAFGENWETRVLPRDDIFVLSVRGKTKDLEGTLKAAYKLPKDADQSLSRTIGYTRNASVPVYSDLVLSEPANPEGKCPFVYVLGPTGATPVYKALLDAKSVKDAKAAIAKERKKMAAAETKWEAFYGTVVEDKRSPALVKAIEKGKTAKVSLLAPVAKAIQKDIVSKDAERATTAQILFDALEQTRGDLVMRIKMEAGECPHRAAYDMMQLLKYWPIEKKRLDVVQAKLKALPEANKLTQFFGKLMVWADPSFTCKNESEAKKIVAELNKIKKDLEKLKESKETVVQNGALLMDAQVDELISVMPTRVPAK